MPETAPPDARHPAARPRRFRPVMAVLAALLSLATPLPALADRALVIGIDAYQRDARITPLAGAVTDARRIADHLTRAGGFRPDQLLVLTDADATRAAILAGIEDWLIAGTRPGERAVLFFAGHGTHVPSLTESGGRDQVLVAVDSHFDSAGELQEFLRDKELGALLDRLADRQVTVIVDACHSGEITRSAVRDQTARMRTFPLPAAPAQTAASRSASMPAPGTTLVESRPGRTVWAAASATQPAWETTRDGQTAGVFTTAFLDGLSGAADADGNGQVSHLELHNWLLDVSARACAEITACLSLTPTLEVARMLQLSPVDASFGAGSAAPSDPADPPQTGTETAELAETLLQPPAEAAPVSATAASADATEERLRLRIETGGETRSRLAEGDSVHFVVEAGFDGYLTLLDINPRGEMVQLFPNRFSQAAAGVFGPGGDRILAGQPVRLPDATYGFAFTVQPPLGDGVLLAVVTADPVDLSDLAAASRSLIVMGPDQSADWLLQLRERLRQPIQDPAGFERQPRYAIGTLAYRTERR